MIPDPKHCPVCGSAIAENAPEGLCPKCLWASLIVPAEEDIEGALTFLPSPFSTSSGSEHNSWGAFGDYQLLGEIARGGMGIVFRTRQISLDRVVALKMILTARLPGEAGMKRFRAEAEAIASLDHPNIVPIYEVGDSDGHPFFTMKFVGGGSLANQLSEGLVQRDGLRTATFVAKIARAVHHAHQRGILHRDLKPSNILIDERDEPLVTDFGLAKQIESDSDLTLSGAVVGTPAYIAPEQATGAKGITTAADIYSLGAIFYELLTQRPPFQAGTALETLRQVIEGDVRPPRLLNKSIEPDLETICLKCLAKEPSQRYASAEALAEDLDCWMRNEPIKARRSSVPERAIKWSKRHPARAIIALLGLIVPLAVIAILLAANAQVRKASNETRENLYAADMFAADGALRAGDIRGVRAALARHIPVRGDLTHLPDFRGFEWRLLWELSQGDDLRVLSGFPRPPSSLAISPDGRTLAVGGLEFLWRWDLDQSTGTELLPPKEPRWLDPEQAAAVIAKVRSGPFLPYQVDSTNPSPGQVSQMVNPERTDDVTALSFSPDGRRILTTTLRSGRAARVWDVADGGIQFAFPAVYSSGSFSPAAPIVAISSRRGYTAVQGGSVKFYDLEKRSEIWALPDAGSRVAFSGDGQMIAAAGWDYTTQKGHMALWSMSERRLVKQFPFEHSSEVFGLSPDARFIALTRAQSPIIEIWSVELARVVHQLTGHSGEIRALAFSPDSQSLVTGGVDQIVRVWSVATGKLVGQRMGHTDEVASLAFFPNGQQFASASRDRTARLWSIASAVDKAMPHHAEGIYGRILFSDDGRWWTSSENQSSHLKVWETDSTSNPRSVLPSSVATHNAGFDESRNAIVTSVALTNAGVELQWRSLKDLSLLRKLSLDRADGALVSVRHYCARANLFAIGQRDGLVRVWSTRTGALLNTFTMPDHRFGEARLINPLAHLVISPDGTLLAAGFAGISQISVFFLSENKLIFSHHTQPLTQLFESLQDSGRLGFLGFSPDSKLLVSADTSESQIRLWDARTGVSQGRLAGHQSYTVEASFSPDGRTLASSGADGSVKLWHMPTRREVASLKDSGRETRLSFSPDGSVLLVASDSKVRIFRAATLVEIDRAH